MQTTTLRRRVLSAAAIATLVMGVPPAVQYSTDAATSPPSVPAAVTQAPSTTGPAAAGRLVSAVPIGNLDPVLASVTRRADRITYHSRSLSGADIVVSGVLLTPRGRAPRGGWPVVSFAHGSSGIADRCAPSTAPNKAGQVDLYGYGAFVAELVKAGYAIAATDYEGLGTPGAHPYIVADSEARSVIDAARASIQADSHLSNKVFFVGHSQGGQAAIAAGELVSTWGRGLDFRGTVGLAPVTNVGDAYGWGSPGPGDRGFYLLALRGLETVHPTLRYDQYLGSQALKLLPKVDSECTAQIWTDFSTDFGDKLSDYQFTPQNLGAALRLQDWLQEQSVPRRRTAGPMLLLQGDRDSSIKIPVTAQAVRNAGASGARAEFRVYPGKDHYTVLTPRGQGGAATDVVAWLRHNL
jgi:alpha-beta hydrolase superfamily lysophospholipase